MGLFSKIGETTTFGNTPYIGDGHDQSDHLLVLISMKQGKNRNGNGLFAANFEVVESTCHPVGSQVKIVETNKHEIEIMLRNVKGCVQACACSAQADSVDEITHVSSDAIDEGFMLEACFGPFECEFDDEGAFVGYALYEPPKKGEKPPTLGDDDADTTAYKLLGGIPKPAPIFEYDDAGEIVNDDKGLPVIAGYAEPGTTLTGAVVHCRSYRKDGKVYQVRTWTPRPMSSAFPSEADAAE